MFFYSEPSQIVTIPLTLFFNTSSLLMPNTNVETSSQLTFIVSSSGNTIETVNLTDNSNQFVFSPTSFVLTGGVSSQTINATFTPTTLRTVTGSLTLSSSGGDIKLLSFRGSGTEQHYSNVSVLLDGQTTGSTFIDSGPNNFTIVKNGNTVSSSFSAHSKESGKWSVYFPPQAVVHPSYGDVRKNSLTVAGTTSTGNIGTNWTLETWFKGGSSSTRNTIVGKTDYNTDSTNSWVASVVSGSGLFVFQMYYGSGYPVNFKTFSSTSRVDDNSWHHIAFVKQGTTYRIFIDGVKELEEVFATSINSGIGQNITIGGVTVNAGTTGDYGRTDCYLSNLRINTTAIYTSNFTPSVTPLQSISGTVLLTCQERNFKDNGPNNYSITVQVGTPQIKDDCVFVNTNPTTNDSIYFDGTNSYLSLNNQLNAAQYNLGSGNFTIEGWIYPHSVATGGPTIYGNYGRTLSNLNRNGSHMLRIVNSRIQFYSFPDADFIMSTTSLIPYSWYHFALTRSGSTWRMFINGNLESTITRTLTLTSDPSHAPTLGSFWQTNSAIETNSWFNGYIDDFRLTKNIARYTGSFTLPSSF